MGLLLTEVKQLKSTESHFFSCGKRINLLRWVAAGAMMRNQNRTKVDHVEQDYS